MNNANRKRQLIAEGRVWRAEVLHSKEVLREGLRPDSMARRVLGQVAVVGLSALRAKGGIGLPGLNLGAILPIVISGVSAFAKRKGLLKPALRGAVIAGATAAIAALVFRRRKKRADSMEDDTETIASDV